MILRALFEAEGGENENDEVKGGVDFDTVGGPTSNPEGGPKNQMGAMASKAPNPQTGPGSTFPSSDQREISAKTTKVIAKVSNLPLITDYDHSDSSIKPEDIVLMDDEALSSLYSEVRTKMKSIEIEKRHGLYDDQTYVYLTKLLDFVDATIKANKTTS